MDDKTVIEVLKYVGIAIAAGVTWFLKKNPLKKYIKTLRNKRALDRWRKGVEDMKLIGLEQFKLYQKYKIPRNAFFIAHNCGDIPTKEKNFYSSLKDSVGICADGKDIKLHMEEDFGEKILVDFKYAEILEEVVRKDYYHFFTDDLDECILKSIYKKEDVAETIMTFYSFDVNTKIFSFSSHSRYNNDEPFSDDQISAIKLSGNIVRTKLEENAN